VKARRGKMGTTNKLAVLEKIKQEKGVLIGSFLNDLTEQNKVRSGRK
jgi:phosphosulfolactate phosphohydrolase-like enzyme